MHHPLVHLQTYWHRFTAKVVAWVRHWERLPIGKRKPQVLVVFGLLMAMMCLSVYYSFRSTLASDAFKESSKLSTPGGRRPLLYRLPPLMADSIRKSWGDSVAVKAGYDTLRRDTLTR